MPTLHKAWPEFALYLKKGSCISGWVIRMGHSWAIHYCTQNCVCWHHHTTTLDFTVTVKRMYKTGAMRETDGNFI